MSTLTADATTITSDTPIITKAKAKADTNPDRDYRVLEPVVIDGKAHFIDHGVHVGRNAAAVCRSLFDSRFGADDDGAIDLVAIAEKMWNPKTLSSSRRRTVRVG